MAGRLFFKRFIPLGSLVILVAAMSLATIAVANDRLPEGTQLDLYLLIGQSNMAGRGEVGSSDKRSHDRVWSLNKSKKLVPAVEPIQFDKRGKVGVGPGRAFGVELAKDQEYVFIGLVPAAMGGSNIDSWQKGSNNYNNAVARARNAMANGQLKAILWHQGESETGSQTKVDSYLAKLKQLIDNLRADLGSDIQDSNGQALPFIVGELGRFYDGKKKGLASKINDQLAHAAQEFSAVGCVSSKDLSHRGDHLHFDSESARQLGQRYAEVLADVIAATHTSRHHCQ